MIREVLLGFCPGVCRALLGALPQTAYGVASSVPCLACCDQRMLACLGDGVLNALQRILIPEGFGVLVVLLGLLLPRQRLIDAGGEVVTCRIEVGAARLHGGVVIRVERLSHRSDKSCAAGRRVRRGYGCRRNGRRGPISRWL